MQRMSTLEQRFWVKVHKSSDDGCWPWKGARNGRGYGTIREGGPGNNRRLMANRVSYELTYGKFDPTLCVCHRCDNPICVRPDHLFLGTKGDNNADRWSKGRYEVVHTGMAAGWAPKERAPSAIRGRTYELGSEVHNARLTEEKVSWIRLNAGKLTCKAMADILGVDRTCVHQAMVGKSWKHVTTPPCAGRT